MFPSPCQTLNCISHNSATENRWGFILLLLGWSTPRSQRRGQCRDVPGSAGDAAEEIEGPRYVLAQQAAWTALVTFGPALDFQNSNSGAWLKVVTLRQQLWGLQGGFYLGTTPLGLAEEFPHWTVARLDFPPSMADLGLARNFSLDVTGGIAGPPGSAQGSSHSTGCSFIFFF